MIEAAGTILRYVVMALLYIKKGQFKILYCLQSLSKVEIRHFYVSRHIRMEDILSRYFCRMQEYFFFFFGNEDPR